MAATTSIPPLRGRQSNDDSFAFETSVGVEPISSFDEMGIDEDLLRAIYTHQFEKPSAIQQRAILPIISGRHVIAQAHSGTGKSTMIAIAACQIVNPKASIVQALILSPTRELAVETEKVISAIGEFKNVHAYACIDGQSIGENIRKIRQVQVVSGTPDTVCAVLINRRFNRKEIKVLILDDSDEMLSRGFEDQIYKVYSYLPPESQIVLISSTLPPKILKMTKLMTDPVRILVKRDESALQGIKQFFVDTEKEERKFKTLLYLYHTITILQAVIFCNTKRQVQRLTKKMRNNNFTVSSMHGGMPHKKRNAAVAEFRSGATRVLITTDVSAGSFATKQVSHVINYDLPKVPKLYIRRFCRAGWFESKGVAINLVTEREIGILRRIEKRCRTQIDAMPMEDAAEPI